MVVEVYKELEMEYSRLSMKQFNNIKDVTSPTSNLRTRDAVDDHHKINLIKFNSAA